MVNYAFTFTSSDTFLLFLELQHIFRECLPQRIQNTSTVQKLGHTHTWGYTPRTLALEWAGWWPPSPHAAMPHTACQVEVMELFRNQDERENLPHNISSHLWDKILSNILNLIAKLSWYIHHEDSLTPSHTEFFRQRGCDLNIWNVFLVAVKERQPPKQENRWQQDNPKRAIPRLTPTARSPSAILRAISKSPRKYVDMLFSQELVSAVGWINERWQTGLTRSQSA